MPSLLRHVECTACGHQHHFCRLVGDVVAGEPYGYVCPRTARRAMLLATRAGETVRYCPLGVVHLEPAADEAA